MVKKSVPVTKTQTPAVVKVEKVAKVAKIAKASKTIKKGGNLSKRFNKLRVKPADLKKKGVVYIGHLPKGFNEEELKKFFEQFGKVSKYRVSRSKKVTLSFSHIFL